MTSPELPKKRTQTIIQPLSNDLHDTTINTAEPITKSTYPAADTEQLSQGIGIAPAQTAHHPTGDQQAPILSTNSSTDQPLTPEKQAIYDQYIANRPIKRERPSKRVEYILTVITVIMIAIPILTILNAILAVVTSRDILSSSGAVIPVLIFPAIQLITAVYLFRRYGLARVFVRFCLGLMLLFFTLAALHGIYLAGRIMMASDNDIPLLSYLPFSLSFAPMLLTCVAMLFIFVFLGRRDVRILFS